jgi:hypothetical protein
MRKTGLLLSIGGITAELREYQFPESREKFNVFVNGKRTQAARTQGIGRKDGDTRNYTYLKIEGTSMYVKSWIDADAHVTVTRGG